MKRRALRGEKPRPTWQEVERKSHACQRTSTFSPPCARALATSSGSASTVEIAAKKQIICKDSHAKKMKEETLRDEFE
jgi:hypothetical protein